MAIKLENALINLHIENNQERISQVVRLLVKHGYEPSTIKPSLLISDMVYIEIAEEFGHYEIKEALYDANIGFSNPQEFDDHMEQMYNRLIPNREPEHPEYLNIAKQCSISQCSEELDSDIKNTSIQNLTPQNKFLWPEEYYCANVKEEDKQTFEDTLHKFCNSKKKSLTTDVANYLKLKKSQNIIKRPIQINTEFEIIKRFGYPYGKGAYYKA